jgi:hypothetical protein
LRIHGASGLRNRVWEVSEFFRQVAEFIAAGFAVKRRFWKLGRWFFPRRDSVQFATGLMCVGSDLRRRC